MRTELLAESIFSLVIHGMGTKAQIVDAIAKEIEKHHEPVRDTYKFDDFETIRKCIEDFCARFTPGNYKDVIESTGNALGALDRIYNAYESVSEPRTCETCAENPGPDITADDSACVKCASASEDVERLKAALTVATQDFVSSNGTRPEWWISVLDLFTDRTAGA